MTQGSSVGLAHHPVAEHDGDLSVAGAAGHRLHSRLFGCVGAEPSDVVLELAHEKEQAHDDKRPRHQDYSEKDAISHYPKCRRR